jgi:hypothetical protein
MTQRVHCLFASLSHAVLFADSVPLLPGETPAEAVKRVEATIKETHAGKCCFPHLIKLACWSESQLHIGESGKSCTGDTCFDDNALDYAYNFSYNISATIEQILFNSDRLRRTIDNGERFYDRAPRSYDRSAPQQHRIELTKELLEAKIAKHQAEFDTQLADLGSFLTLFGREHQLPDLKERLISHAQSKRTASLARRAQ